MVARHLLDMYVNHLRQSAPSGWSARQINFHLFEKSPDTTPLTKDLRVTDGLKALTLRKSIPSLDPLNRISAGMIRAELMPQFTGGLRILYHPLASLLLMPTSLREIYELLSACAYAGCFSFLVGTPREVLHRQGNVRLEIKNFFSAIRTCPDSLKEAAFYDFKAIALGMFLEARALENDVGQAAWYEVLMNESLSFSCHPKLASNSASALDSLVRHNLSAPIAPERSHTNSQLEYLKKYVFKSGVCRSTLFQVPGSDLTFKGIDVNGMDASDVRKIEKAIVGLFV